MPGHYRRRRLPGPILDHTPESDFILDGTTPAAVPAQRRGGRFAAADASGPPDAVGRERDL
jgi:hypothetical protein